MQGLEARWWEVDGARVRGLVAGSAGPLVVLLPGLGVPEYLTRWARLTARWARVVLLDLPGWGVRDERPRPSTVAGVADATVRWLRTVADEDVVLVGHSTGSTSALLAAVSGTPGVRALFLAGLVFDPPARRLPVLALRCLGAVTPRLLPEVPLMAPPLVRGVGRGLVRHLASALAERPEELLGVTPVPTTLATGAQDRFGKPSWVTAVAAAAGVPTVVLPGRHNCVFTHPWAVDAALRATVPA